MVKNIIFDLGNVFINLDNDASQNELLKFGMKNFNDEMIEINQNYEKGLVTTKEFVNYYLEKFPNKTQNELIKSWNSVLFDFPKNRCSFLEKFPKNYKLFLFSNTNELHIDYFKTQVGYDFYKRFLNCFEKVYYSFEMKSRKPDLESFELILKENDLIVSETLFVDDTLTNIESANKLGIKTWHLNPSIEDVTELFSVKSDLFDKLETELI